MSSPESGALAAVAQAPAPAPAPAAQAKATTTTTTVDFTTSCHSNNNKHRPDVHITPLSVSPSQAPSAVAASNPPSSPPHSRTASSAGDDDAASSLNSQKLAWDQAVLRIEYLVSTMTTPSPYSPILSPLDNASYANNNTLHSPISPLVGGLQQEATPNLSPTATPTDFHINTGGRLVRTEQEVDADAPPATKGWPSVPREKVRRKVLQIDTWRAEVESHGTAAFCACSSPAPMIPTSGALGSSDHASKQPRSPVDAATASIPPLALSASPPREGGAATLPSPITIPPPVILCGFCGRPPAPFVALKSPTVAAGVKKAFVDGFKGLLRRRSGSRKGREKDRDKIKVMEASGTEKEKGQAKGAIEGNNNPSRPGQPGRHESAGDVNTQDAAFVRTEMYHIDMPVQARPSPESPSNHDRQSPVGQGRDVAAGHDSNDGDEEDVDLDNLSQSTNPRGLLQTNDRLKRAEKLLAKSRGGAVKASGGVEGTKSLPTGEGGGGGGNGGFGLGWGKNNVGDRSRKGFGKLL